MPGQGDASPRLLVVTDLDRLGPIVRECFSPHPIFGVRSYLTAIAEIPKSPTRAVLVGYDPGCRKIEAAVKAIKTVAGDAPVVVCCEPAYENVGRRLLAHGADDYVIFPPDAADLEATLGIVSRKTQRRWIELPPATPTPSAEEIARLADVLPRLTTGDPALLDALAALVCVAVNAETATIVFGGRTGRAGRSRRGAEATGLASLVEPITEGGGQRVGQIRVGPSLRGGYAHEDTTKLRHYGVLLSRLLEHASRASSWRTMALVDELTGLPNRRRLTDFLMEKLALAAKARSTVTVLYFDIDDFKHYNDQYGHDAGDEILCDIGRLFEQCTRETDLVARIGGDEFIVVFWDPGGPRALGSDHPTRVMEIVQRFRDALQKHTFKRLGAEAQGCLTISGGLAHYPWDAHDAPSLIEAADRALIQAKEAGKNRFWVVGNGDVCSS